MPKKARVPQIGKQMKGALGESLAAAWLIKQGWQVYQQVGLCLVDMLCYDPETREVLRVEVKTASVRTDSRGKASFYWKVRPDQYEHCDMLIVVSPEGHVFDATDVKPSVGLEVAGEPVMFGEVKRTKGKVKQRVLDDEGNRIV